MTLVIDTTSLTKDRRTKFIETLEPTFELSETEDVSINGLRRPTRRAAEMGRRRNVGGLPTSGRRP